MSRQLLITCDLCGATWTAGAVGWDTWRALDLCAGCLASSRTVGEVLELFRKADVVEIRPEDIVPERTRPRARH